VSRWILVIGMNANILSVHIGLHDFITVINTPPIPTKPDAVLIVNKEIPLALNLSALIEKVSVFKARAATTHKNSMAKTKP